MSFVVEWLKERIARVERKPKVTPTEIPPEEFYEGLAPADLLHIQGIVQFMRDIKTGTLPAELVAHVYKNADSKIFESPSSNSYSIQHFARTLNAHLVNQDYAIRAVDASQDPKHKAIGLGILHSSTVDTRTRETVAITLCHILGSYLSLQKIPSDEVHEDNYGNLRITARPTNATALYLHINGRFGPDIEGDLALQRLMSRQQPFSVLVDTRTMPTSPASNPL